MSDSQEGGRHDPVYQFFTESHNITSEAQFIIDSFPNTDSAAVERVVHQLIAIRTILHSFHDPYGATSIEDIEELLTLRLWLDVRKDSLETFRQIFDYLETNNLWDKENTVHCLCLFLVFQPRIQSPLNRTRDAWNHHKIRTASHRTPIAMYELSREQAIRRGYWMGDVGDDIETANDPFYGEEGALGGNSLIPPPEGLEEGTETHLNEDLHLELAKALLGEFDYERDGGNWEIEVYCEAVIKMENVLWSNDIDIPMP
ncbi:uncharacterized protein EV420DRAFT_1278502 [Desarmillaria tabescens]|uniref:Integrase core domain-containing protein n=1 Tax=Armillaria tabescens TaxID=1929756 RepID=A0AA39MPN9_ARMTA|nr:uncharacterized protein EV420DRAFT_1278502 [Desarmillaria tabescens]KAK0442052.1 hypothetical protein EV420DRAFT_1278502 [Desarmillaria tabescens]